MGSNKDEWFSGRRWRVVTEADGDGFVSLENGGGHVPVRFDKGRFAVEPPGAFRSPLSGNPGRRGVLLQEVDAGGRDIPGSRFAFGEAAVSQARKDYHAIL